MEPSYTLSTPWYGDNIVNLADTVVLLHRVKTTPTPFARRKVFCGNRLYKNKYELNEWLQEARSKGMSNPRDIWRYAQQKERLFMSMTCLASPPRFASQEIGSPKAVVNHFNIVTDKG